MYKRRYNVLTPSIAHICKMQRYRNLTYDYVISQNLQVADQSSFVLARDYNMPLYVFDFDEPDAISKVCNGEEIGTYVGKDCKTELY